MKRALILSDDRLGHLNQSLAFVKYLGIPYDIVTVPFKKNWYKGLSYVFDRLGIRTDKLFTAQIDNKYDMVVGTGSTTAYATKVLAKKLGAKSIIMMLPHRYRYDFDILFAQRHDNPPKQKNIIEIPANFSYIEPQGIYRPNKKSIGIIIGGDNKLFRLSQETITEQLNYIVKTYTDYEIAITTSPRTSKDLEKIVEDYAFDYEVIFSKNPINPIADFLEQCETVFITGDSTSMISEAVSYGNSNVVVLPVNIKEKNKFTRFVNGLEQDGYLHIFDGTIQNRNKKIDFRKYLKKIDL